MILMTRSYWSYWSDISDIPRHVNIPLLSPNYTLHTLHSTSPIRSDHTDGTIQLTSFMTILSVIRLHLQNELHNWNYIFEFGCYWNMIYIDVKIVLTCTAGSRRIHWGRWWVQRFLLPGTRRPVISSLGESSPRSKHTPAPAHDTWHDMCHNMTWYDRSRLFFVACARSVSSHTDPATISQYFIVKLTCSLTIVHVLCVQSHLAPIVPSYLA